MAGFNMEDYVPVNERIDAFKAEFPDGCLQSEIVELSESRVIVKAYAYRTPDDARPGIGHSSVEIPGKTTFTKGSEIENAETSAWGRAIVALGFETKRGIASQEEVRNKQPGQGDTSVPTGRAKPPAASSKGVTDAAPAPAEFANRGQIQQAIVEAAKERGLGISGIDALAKELGIARGEATMEQLLVLLVAIERGEPEKEAAEAVA